MAAEWSSLAGADQDGLPGLDVHQGLEPPAEGRDWEGNCGGLSRAAEGLGLQVLRLFKSSMRMTDAWYAPDKLENRYHRVVLRNRFDQLAGERDPHKARRLLMEGCEELWRKTHPMNLYKARDPAGGISYGRESDPLDYMADNYEYIEREQYALPIRSFPKN